jgi:lysophospholipase L1-like esterase
MEKQSLRLKRNSNRILIGLMGFLALGLAISVALNFIIYSFSRQYYLQLNATRLDPLGLTVYEDSQVPDPNPQKMRVVFFGDSRAYAWPVPNGLEQFQFINRGVGAQTSMQIVERFDDHIEPLQPDIIILQLCINDLKTIPLFPHLKESIIATCKANITKIVTESRNLGAEVILTTIFPLGEIPIERRIVWSDDVAEAIDGVNGFIHSLAGEGVTVIDAGTILTDERGIVRGDYSRDFLHLNEAGYRALNETLVGVLMEINEEN